MADKKLLTVETYFPSNGTQAANSLMPEPNESVILKILIIGDPCVGKTSFVQRYVNGTFHRNYKGTIGVDFALKIIKCPTGGTVKLQLWDVAGQERYTSMTRVYYRDAHGCIIMFDLTNRNSFLNVTKWKRDFDSKCVLADGTTVPCVLVGNKSDMKALRQVQDEEIERLCQEFNFASWAEMSVKDNLMVDDCMKHLVRGILSHERMSVSRPIEASSALKLGKAGKEQTTEKNGCKLCGSS
jgi:Ras-related protein Rab-7L1